MLRFRALIYRHHRPLKNLAAAALATACLAAAGGCSTLAYYSQAIGGELHILHQRKPIQKLIADPDTPPELRRKLVLAARIRNFASAELGLPDNGSYKSYVDLKRPYVSWAVFAAPELSLAPKTWCFPFAGCVAYRGYFDKTDAVAFAAELRHENYDVFVSGVPAFSTLGHFDDPLLSSMMQWSEADFAALIFHELAHQEVYAAGDTAFNEAFASVVAEVGVGRWFAAEGKPEKLAEWRREQSRRAAFNLLVGHAREQLQQLYATADSVIGKRLGKQAVLQSLREQCDALASGWKDDHGPRLPEPLNNATLAALASYSYWRPAFHALLENAGGKLPDFYKAVRRLADLDKQAREAKLRALMPRSAPSGAGASPPGPSGIR